MQNLLVIQSSGRQTRSVTRHLADRFIRLWQTQKAGAKFIVRDVGLNPPPTVSEAWIAAAFGAAVPVGEGQPHPLAASDMLIDEVERADAIVIAAPMYNYGMPAQLKAWFDQIVRVDRTFAFDPGAPNPYRPLLTPKPVVIIVSVGDGELLPGGALAHLNFLEPHLATILALLGLTDVTFIRAGFDEQKDDRAKRSLAAAEKAVDETVERLAAGAGR